MPSQSWPRVFAAVSAVSTGLGAAVITWATLAMPGFSAQAYLSELGIPGASHRPAYLIGLSLMTIGLVTLGIALASICITPKPLILSPLTLLGLSGVLLANVAAFPCSTRCPLPPHGNNITFSDVMHGLGATTATVAIFGAMVGAVKFGNDTVTRRYSLVFGAITLVSGLLEAVSILVQARGLTNGISERVLVSAAASWAFLVAIRLIQKTKPEALPQPSAVQTAAQTARN